jgi:hypothetical protein
MSRLSCEGNNHSEKTSVKGDAQFDAFLTIVCIFSFESCFDEGCVGPSSSDGAGWGVEKEALG